MSRPFNALRSVLNSLRSKATGRKVILTPPETQKTVEDDGLVVVEIPKEDRERSAVDVVIGRRDPFPELDRSGLDEMSTHKGLDGRILEAHRMMTSDEQWVKHREREAAHEAGWKLFEENLESLLEKHPGKFVAIQDGTMIIGDNAEQLTTMLVVERPHIIIPVRRFARNSEVLKTPVVSSAAAIPADGKGPGWLPLALILSVIAFGLVPDSHKAMWMVYALLAGVAIEIGWLFKRIFS